MLNVQEKGLLWKRWHCQMSRMQEIAQSKSREGEVKELKDQKPDPKVEVSLKSKNMRDQGLFITIDHDWDMQHAHLGMQSTSRAHGVVSPLKHSFSQMTTPLKERRGGGGRVLTKPIPWLAQDNNLHPRV